MAGSVRGRRRFEFGLAVIGLTVTVAASTSSWWILTAIRGSIAQLDPGNRASLVAGAFPDVIAGYVGPGRPFDRMALLDVGGCRYRTSASSGRAVCLEATVSLTSILSIPPLVGRTFSAADETASEGIALLTEDFATPRFGTPENAVDQTIAVQGVVHRVVGVVGRTLDVLGGAEIIIAKRRAIPGRIVDSSTATRLTIDGVLVRLSDDAQPDGALQVLHRDGAADKRLGVPLAVTRLRDALERQFQSLRSVLWAGVVLVIASGWSTITLLNARSIPSRAREVATRLALGADMRALMTPFLRHWVGLAALSGTLGLLLVSQMSAIVRAAFPQFAHFLPMGTFTWSIAAFAILVAATGASIGLLPNVAATWRVRREHLTALLNGAGHAGRLFGAAAGQRGWIAVQIGCSVALFGCAVLLCRTSLDELIRDRGFLPDRLVAFELAQPVMLGQQPRPASTAEREARLRDYDARTSLFYDDVLGGLGRLSQVEAIGATSRLPMSPFGPSGQFVDRGETTGGFAADVVEVAGDFFAAVGAHITRGTAFLGDSASTAQWPVVVSDSVAERLWPAENPIGQTLRISRGRLRRVVATVQRMDVTGLGSDFPGQVFIPSRQPVYFVRNDLAVVLRTRPGAAASALDVRVQVNAVRPGTLIHSFSQGSDLLSAALQPVMAQASLSVAVALSMLLLSCLGIVGAIQQWVLDRRREMRIRMILGATPIDLARRTLWQASGLLAAGALTGVVLAYWAGRTMGTGLVSARFTLVDVLPGLAVAALIVLTVSYRGARMATFTIMVTRE